MPPDRLPLLAVGLAAMLATPFAFADFHSSRDDPFAQQLPMVLTASRLAQSPLDAPAAVTIIDREMIEASGFTEIHDLLRLVPGFLVADWPDGSPTIANHGLGDAYDRRIKVLVDGRAISSPLWGDTLWHDLTIRIDDIERIEVVRGPHGAAYGANAFQGVVNIITRAPATESGTTVISRIGTENFYDHGIRLNGGAGGPIDWRLSASRRSGLNFKPHTDIEGDVYSREAITRNVFNFQASHQLSAIDELRLQFGAMDGIDDRGYPITSGEGEEWPIRDEEIRSHHLHLGWTRSFDPGHELKLQYAWQTHQRRADWIIHDSGRDIPTDLDTDTSRHDLEIQYSRQLDPQWHFLVGAGVRQDAVKSRRYFDTDRTLRANYWQTFGSVTWKPIEKLAVNLGGTYEKHDYSGHLFSPRLALNYTLTPLSALRMSMGKSYRAPSLMESHATETIRYGDEVVRVLYNNLQKVDPEEVVHFEIGYVAQLPQWGLSIDTRVFQDRYDNYLDDEVCRYRPPPRSNCGDLGFPTPIGFSPNPLSTSNYYFLNLGRTTVRGGEITLDWRRPGWGRVVLSQAFTHIEASRQLDEEDADDSAPAAMTSLLLIKDLPGRWRASLGYYHTHPVHWLNDGGPLPKSDRFDLKIARAFGENNEIALTFQSLGGKYPEFHDENYRHRPRAFLSVRATW